MDDLETLKYRKILSKGVWCKPNFGEDKFFGLVLVEDQD